MSEVVKKDVWGDTVKFFRDVKSEMKKVTWPTREQVVNNTMVVIATLVVIGIFIAIVDIGFAKVIEVVFGKR